MRKKSPWFFLAMFIVPCLGARAALAHPVINDWQWHPVEDSSCGDGSPTGFGINAHPEGSRNLVIFFQGGGACRDYFECYILQTATHLNGYNEDSFASEVASLSKFPLVNRDHPKNPFGGMHMALFPYCTGDLHAGHKVADYGAYHLGGDNATKYLELLATQFPRVKNVWLVGFSAGGFGAVFNWEVAQQTFPHATVHVVDDSGLAFADSSIVPEQWDVIETPEDCDGCQDNMSLLLPYIANRSPKSRVAWVSYDIDTTLPFFLSLARSDFSADLLAFAEQIDTINLPNLAYFYAPGEGHVVSFHADQDGYLEQYIDWLGNMVTQNDAWGSERAQPSPVD